MSIQQLKQLIRVAPKKPGIYIFKNASGKSIYIGKAVNIRSRLLNYPGTADSRIRSMLEEAKKIAWTETPTEIEALILESQLIKKNRPKFNIVMRDDKQYFFVVFSYEEFPRITLSHQPDAGSSHIGPFTDGAPLKNVLRLLRRMFPYCTCKQKHHVRCLNAHIGKCPGFCCLKNKASAGQVSEYIKNINAIKAILSGKRTALIKKIRNEMKNTAKTGALETAIALKKQVASLERVFENAAIIRKMEAPLFSDDLGKILGVVSDFHRIEGYDIANIQGTYATGSMIVFTDGQPDKNEYRKFTIKTVRQSNDTAMLTEILSRRFKHSEWPVPDLIIVDGGVPQMNAVKRMAGNIPVIALTKDQRHRGSHIYSTAKKGLTGLMELPYGVRNLILHIDNEAHRFAISHYRLLHRRNLKK